MMTLSDLLLLLITIGCTVGGVGAGHHAFGVPGAVLGGFTGLLIGQRISRYYTQWVIRRHRKKLAPFTTEELEQRLIDFDWEFESPNYLFVELMARGADVTKYLPLVLEWLGSEDLMKRAFGYAALRTAFPQTALQLGRFNEYEPVENCRSKVGSLKRNWIESDENGAAE